SPRSPCANRNDGLKYPKKLAAEVTSRTESDVQPAQRAGLSNDNESNRAFICAGYIANEAASGMARSTNSAAARSDWLPASRNSRQYSNAKNARNSGVNASATAYEYRERPKTNGLR